MLRPRYAKDIVDGWGNGGISLLNLNFIQRERVSLRRWIFLGGELVDVCAVKGDLNCEYELCEIYRVHEDLWREIIVNFVAYIFIVF